MAEHTAQVLSERDHGHGDDENQATARRWLFAARVENVAGRALLGAFAGAILAPFWMLWTQVERPEWMLQATELGAGLGAVVGAVVGHREIRGKAKTVVTASLSGTLLGILTGWLLGLALEPSMGKAGAVLRGVGVIFGAMGGATIGAIVGRVRHGGRLTLGEIMIVVAIAGLILAAITAMTRL